MAVEADPLRVRGLWNYIHLVRMTSWLPRLRNTKLLIQDSSSLITSWIKHILSRVRMGPYALILRRQTQEPMKTSQATGCAIFNSCYFYPAIILLPEQAYSVDRTGSNAPLPQPRPALPHSVPCSTFHQFQQVTRHHLCPR